MSFTNSTFTFINCEDPSKRFSVTNDEIRQMELKINVVHKESENWKHIANKGNMFEIVETYKKLKNI